MSKAEKEKLKKEMEEKRLQEEGSREAHTIFVLVLRKHSLLLQRKLAFRRKRKKRSDACAKKRRRKNACAWRKR